MTGPKTSLEGTKGTPDIPLEVQIGEHLRTQELTLATAESSTGGLVAKRLTDIPGSSDYMIGGVVCYAARAKQHVLGVQSQTLSTYGAVSEPVTQEMAERARHLFEADFALSVTGFAGPTGATPTLPLGLHYVGLSAADGTWIRRDVGTGNREQNRQAAADAVFRLLLAYLDGEVMSFRVITVEAMYTPDGWPMLSSLCWDGETLPIVDQGRRWRADDGIHMLVRVVNGRVFELHTNGTLWRASVVSDPPNLA